jgi:hypothetical protein
MKLVVVVSVMKGGAIDKGDGKLDAQHGPNRSVSGRLEAGERAENQG